MIDVAVVGQGTTGAAVAALCARRGLSVVGLERHDLQEAGARWVNGVSGWQFDEAQIERPSGDELFGVVTAFHVVAGWGPQRVTAKPDLLEVDMRKLVARLQQVAIAHGATLHPNVTAHGAQNGILETSIGRIEARWIVDASGFSGARLIGQPRIQPRDICAAAQEVRRVVDIKAARSFFESHGAAPGDTVCFTSIAGGYSIVNVTLKGETIGILTGSIPADGYPTGKALIDQFVEKHAWIGDTIFGGARKLPLGRPIKKFSAGNVIAIGDAAVQMFSAHGSGIGAGLIAANLLAETLATGGDAARYERLWRKRYGLLFGAYDLVRRFSQNRTPEQLAALMRIGVVSPNSIKAGLEQRWPAPFSRA